MVTAMVWWIAAAGWFAFIIAETWTPLPVVPAPDAADWVLHGAGVLIMGAILRMASAQTWQHGYNFPAIAIGAALGGIDEVGQIPVPGRSATLSDLLADAVGTVLGVLLAGAIAKILLTRRGKNIAPKLTGGRDDGGNQERRP